MQLGGQRKGWLSHPIHVSFERAPSLVPISVRVLRGQAAESPKWPIVKFHRSKPQEAYGMDRRYCGAVFAAVLLACVMISGCHSGTGTTVLTSTTTALPNGTVSTPYFAALTLTGGTAPYTWSQTSGGAMPGGITFSSAGVFSGTPTAAGSFGPYAFTVTDANSDTAVTGNLNITINSSTLSVTTTSLPGGTVGTAYSLTLAATGGTSPYSWAETSGGALPSGLAAITSGGVIGGTPTTAGVYGPYVFSVTDSKNTTATSASMTIAIAATGVSACPPQQNEAALTSANPYAFLVKGTDASGAPIDIAGSFTPNGIGGIADAAVDYNGFTNGHEQLQVNLTASSYSFSPTAQGCLYLVFSGYVTTQPSVKDQRTRARPIAVEAKRSGGILRPAISGSVVPNAQFSFELSSFDGTLYHTGRIIESDFPITGTNASGFLHIQDPSSFSLASLQPNYAFGVDGWTASFPGILRTALAGTFTNTSGALSAGYADLNEGGNATGELMGGYGTIDPAIDPASGRGTGSYFLSIPTSPVTQLTFDFVFYILNGADVILLSTDDPANNTTSSLLAGRALASNVNYSVGALNGYYLLASQGLDTSGAAPKNLAEVGTLNATSAGTIPTATIYANDAGTYASTQYPNSSYTLGDVSQGQSLSGRVSFTGLTATPPVVYLTAADSDDEIAGFVVGTDAEESSGVLVSQSTNYSVESVSGNWAVSTEEDVDGLNGAYLGAFSFNGSGAYSVVSSQTTGSVPNAPNLGTISVNADGSGSLDGGNFPLVTNGQTLFAIPDSGDPLLFVFTVGPLP